MKAARPNGWVRFFWDGPLEEPVTCSAAPSRLAKTDGDVTRDTLARPSYVKESQWVNSSVAASLAAALLLGCVPARTRIAEPGARSDGTPQVSARGRTSTETSTRPATAAGRAARGEATASTDADYLRARALMVPVQGIAPEQVPNNFSAPRGSRRHNAIDIMAPRGTPVLSADDGRVLSLRRNNAGGKILYVVDDEERLIYYYAHMDGYRSGLREGDRVRKGEVLGYVGTTGNAPDNAPHLHFQVMRYDDPRRYWEGRPLNPHGHFSEAGRQRD